MINDELFVSLLATARKAISSKTYLAYPAEVKNLLLKLHPYEEFMEKRDAEFLRNAMTLVEKVRGKNGPS